MVTQTRAAHPVLPTRQQRLAPAAADPLDEFAAEHETSPQPSQPPTRVWRFHPLHPPIFAWRAVGVAAGVLAASLAAFLGATRDRTEESQPFLVPAPSPIEVEYPDYPGAPVLQTAAAAVPIALAPDRVAQAITLAEPPPIVAARRQPKSTRSEAALPPASAVEPDASNAFDVRSVAPQLVSAGSGTNVVLPAVDRVRPVDAPPRRIGPSLALTTLSGTVARSARLALVLEVTERGDVARVVSHEAVDVHPDVIDSVTAAARDWRYEPATRDGVPVRARLRVVVELNGGQ